MICVCVSSSLLASSAFLPVLALCALDFDLYAKFFLVALTMRPPPFPLHLYLIASLPPCHCVSLLMWFAALTAMRLVQKDKLQLQGR